MELFEAASKKTELNPLAEHLRPLQFSQILGQAQLSPWIQRFKKGGRIPSLILTGPPGSGKTTFAQCLLKELHLHSENLNAIDIGSKKLKEIGSASHDRRIMHQQQTVVFIDEIHRLNRSQQDVLLPFVEQADFILVGATTENPSYRLNKALMSRCQLIQFEALNLETLSQILLKALTHLKLDKDSLFTSDGFDYVLKSCFGDARRLLLDLEVLSSEFKVTPESFPKDSVQLAQELKKSVPYDQSGSDHYDSISTLIKSMRGSLPDEALFMLVRMLRGGEDPLYIARRLVIFASEDVGNADPRALTLAMSALQACEVIGLPECEINLAQAVTYLASVPKSRQSYKGLRKAQEFLLQTSDLNSKNLPNFYQPSEVGFEKNLKAHLDWLARKGSPT